MSKRIGMRAALGVTAAFIAVIAATAIGPGPGPAHAAINKGWCVQEAPNGEVEFLKQDTSHTGVNVLTFRRGMEEHCDEKHDGAAWMSDKQKDRVEGAGSTFALPALTTAQQFPKKDWFGAPVECSALPNTIGDENRLQHVYAARTAELILQIVYDVGSNEITGITGAILGGILGGAKTATYILEWNYDLQDECQEILERRQIAGIFDDTDKIITDVTTLLNDVSKHDTRLTTETDEIDAALAALAASLTTETDEIDAALAGLKGQLVAGQDQSVRLFIEDHLERCRPLGSLLLSDSAGLLPLTVLVVEDLAARAGAAGLAIGNARLHLDRANDSILAGDAREGFQSLCTAYEQIVRGGRR